MKPKEPVPQNHPHMGVHLAPETSVMWIRSASRQPLKLHLPGYIARFRYLVEVCLEQSLPVFMGGYLPVTSNIVALLGQLPKIWADSTVRKLFQQNNFPSSVHLSAASAPPQGSYPLTLFTVVRDPLWRVFQDLAIPLPRSTCFIVDEPLETQIRVKAQTSEMFSHLLDVRGSAPDLVFSRKNPPFSDFQRELLKIFPDAHVAAPAVAALDVAAGEALADGSPPSAKWLLIHAGSHITTVFSMKGGATEAVFQHQTDLLTPGKLNEYMAQLTSGRHFHRELSLDGGLFLQTRLLPEEPGTWSPIYLCGPRSEDFSKIPADRLIRAGMDLEISFLEYPQPRI